MATLRTGDLDGARRLFDHVRELSAAPGGRRPGAWVEVMLAEVAERQGDGVAAAQHLARAQATFAMLGEQMGLAYCRQRQPAPAT